MIDCGLPEYCVMLFDPQAEEFSQIAQNLSRVDFDLIDRLIGLAF